MDAVLVSYVQSEHVHVCVCILKGGCFCIHNLHVRMCTCMCSVTSLDWSQYWGHSSCSVSKTQIIMSNGVLACHKLSNMIRLYS